MSKPTEEEWKRILKMVDVIYQRPDAEPFREPVPWKALGLTDYPTIIKTPMDLGTIKNKIKKREYKTLYQVNEDVRTVWSNCMTYNADGSDFYKLAELLKKKWDERYSKLLSDIGSGNPVLADEASTNTSAVAATATSSSTSAAGALPVSSTSSAVTGSGTTTTGASATPGAAGSSSLPAASAGSNGGSSTAKSSLTDKRNFAKLLFQISKEELGKVLVDVEARHPSAIKRNATEDEVVLNIDEIPGPLLAELYAFVSSVKAQKKKAPISTNKNKKAKTG